MEHRWGHRCDTSMEVRIFARQSNVPRRGRIVNLSATGAFIETNMTLAPLARIEVEMRTMNGEQLRIVRLPACVVRRDIGGVGVEWCEAAEHTAEEMMTAIHEPAPFRHGGHGGAQGGDLSDRGGITGGARQRCSIGKTP